MNWEKTNQIAKAILYEGYLLYPYRASAVKNKYRWTFGALYPPAYSATQKGNDPFFMKTECLVVAPSNAILNVSIRFLHFQSRNKDDKISQEAVERTIQVPGTALEILNTKGVRFPFEFSSSESVNEGANLRQEEIKGTAEIRAASLTAGTYQITLRLLNETSLPCQKEMDREQAVMHSMISTHAILHMEGGEFVSLLDPPENLREFAQACKNVGNWPVLVGEEGERDAMLASPIILYDYPQVAAESTGDLFDSTEIDEILSLRIMTLTEDEKQELREGDIRARKILERTESIPAEQFMKMHGALRGLQRVPEENPMHETSGPDKEIEQPITTWDPWEKKPVVESVIVFGVEVKKGSRVRLWPVKKADILDMALLGRAAIVEAIEEDFDGQIHLAVIVEDDPGKDLGEMRQPGHRFFFTPEEVEPL